MREETAAGDRILAAIAARQHGVVSTQQLHEAGIGRSGITRRLRSGRLHRLHRGVYAVGHRGLSQEGRWMAAVLACGEDAVLSHRSAAALWGLLPAMAGVVDVTVPGAGGRPPMRGVGRHRSRTLVETHVTRRQGIPVTTPARTIADLRGVASPGEVRRAIRQANVIGLDIPECVEADRTRSELERRFLRLCRRHRLPRPEVNVRIGSFIVDFVWLDRCLVAETDGYRYHRGRQAFEGDRSRDLELRLSGYEVVRFTHRQVIERPADVAALLRTLLS